MTRIANDPDLQLLVSISESLQASHYQDTALWEGSPFSWLLGRPSSKKKGVIFESLVSEWYRRKGFRVAGSPDSEADRIIEGFRIEIKGSTLWEAGSYRFQQIRDQNYDAILCLGISPFDVHCWIIPKREIMHRWRNTEEIGPQHGGRSGTDTAWLVINPANPQAWLRCWGGSLSEASRIMGRLHDYL